MPRLMGIRRCLPHSDDWRKIPITLSDSGRGETSGVARSLVRGLPFCRVFSLMARKNLLSLLSTRRYRSCKIARFCFRKQVSKVFFICEISYTSVLYAGLRLSQVQNGAVTRNSHKFPMTKLAVLAIFAEARGFARPDQIREKLQPSPDRRSFYSYLARLQKQGLLERAPNSRRGRLGYRITRRGQERITYLRRNEG
jgi:hypothetical protein